MHKKRKWKLIVFWIVMITVYLLANTILILEVGGYRFNRKRWTLQKTGLIVLNGYEDNVSVLLNGKKVADRLPARLSFIITGSYIVEVKKDRHFDWQKSFVVEADQAYTENDVVMFLKNSKPVEVIDKYTIDRLEDTELPADIFIEDNEIWADGKLITRFATEPVFCYWYFDRDHILYQLGNEIKIIDMNGYNDISLVKLDSTLPTVFRVEKEIANGEWLIYKNMGKIYKIRIK